MGFKKNQEIDHINNQKHFNSFFQGFSIAILNPKILIWFSAVFSQFVKIDASFFSHSILVITASLIADSYTHLTLPTNREV